MSPMAQLITIGNGWANAGSSTGAAAAAAAGADAEEDARIALNTLLQARADGAWVVVEVRTG